MTAVLCVLLIAGCVLTALYNGAEIAIVSANRLRLRHLESRGVRRSAQALDIARRRETFVASGIVGINAATALVAFVATYLARQVPWLGHGGAAYAAFFAGNVLFLFWIELLPKAIVQLQPTLFLVRLAGFVRGSRALFSPLVVLIDAASNLLLGRTAPGERMTRQDLEKLLLSPEARTAIPGPESEMVSRFLSFSRVIVRDIMTPRELVVSVPEQAPPEEFLAAVRRSGFTRLPVYAAAGQNFTGLVNVFDIVYRQEPPAAIGELMRSVPEIGTSELGWSALLRFQGTPHRMAFVRDAAGRHVGIVTVEDLVEEIMGEVGGKFE
ncbi:MAG TPA: hypothetical protein DCM87_09595 [Planctomycetes bacterium]|nr:hypothetical protein [Planctomycetota bacterium]